jgi:hypothetical protein
MSANGAFSVRAITGISLMGFALLALPLRGQEPALDTRPPPAAARARVAFLVGTCRPEQALTLYSATQRLEEQMLAGVAGALVGGATQDPYTTLATLFLADQLGLVQLNEAPVLFEPDAPKPVDKAEPLLAYMMQGIKDDKPLPTRWNQDLDEQRSYSIFLYQASRISAEAFRRGARRELTYTNVFNHPSKHRGQIVHVEGTLKQLTRFDPPATAKAAGVTDVYEGWIFDQHYGQEPWCVVFTELPSSVIVGERLSVPVQFDGYLFKRYSYKARGTRKGEELPRAPLLIGRTLTVTAPPAVVETADRDWFGSLTPIFLGLVTGSLALALGLAWWFRRGDQRVRQRIAAVSQREFVEPP